MKVIDNIGRITKFLSVGNKMNDSIPIGFLGGLMGTIAMDLSNLFFKKTGLSEKTYAQYAGSVLLSPFRLIFKQNILFGQILHLITGSILGIPMINILKKTGKDNHQFKGAVYGIFTWEMLYSFGQRIGIVRAKTYTTRTLITTLIDTLVYGFASTSTMVFLADRSVFPKASNQQIENRSESQMSKQHEILIGNPTYTNENEININPS
jgi:hypothetical protein